jgi:glycosyltransferase involved in cell wall biosynthesis
MRHRRVALIGNALPRRCGIATFSTDLHQAMTAIAPETAIGIVAMDDSAAPYEYPNHVLFSVDDQDESSYARAAECLNEARYDVVLLQHEFGIFGGPAGAMILSLISRLTMPLVTTLHTVLSEPTEQQRHVMTGLIRHSSRLVVMAEKGAELLRNVYGVASDRIEIIPHGIPDVAFAEPQRAKEKLGFSDKRVILTFGLLSPSKGIEVMIDAMPHIVAHCPDAVYVVLGATHPNLLRDQGEAYRDSLISRVAGLGMTEHVVFLDRFVDKATLLDFIAMCDVYVTPYLNAAQMTSGTLAYSFGLGKAVVSTPYWHARELLAGNRGVLVPFGDVAVTADAVAVLLIDETRRNRMRRNAYAASRSMTWANTAERYMTLLQSVMMEKRLRILPQPERNPRFFPQPPPQALQFGHFLSMCDDTGMYQHAIFAVPDRAHGYCVDDNARALLLSTVLHEAGEKALPEPLASRFAAFVQHAWNKDRGRFRNFMSFDRRWLEDQGSEDSHGRTLWALATCAKGDASTPRREWARRLFLEALPSIEGFSSPRAWAFALLGIDNYLAGQPGRPELLRLRARLVSRLLALLAAVERPGWTWFEEGLSYDNARLAQALIVSGLAAQDQVAVSAGLRTLRWLIGCQKSPTGHFRPIGTESFFEPGLPKHLFDQQPVEAAATISACLSAGLADPSGNWQAEAEIAFAWFHGGNDLGFSLIDPVTGGCHDGLHPDRSNENQGAESVLSYLLSSVDMRRAARASGDNAGTRSIQALRG